MLINNHQEDSTESKVRDSIIFYRSFYEAIRELPDSTQVNVYSAIFEYSLNFNEIVLEGLPKTIFTLIKPQLDANTKRFENGKKGGRKKQEDEIKDPSVNQTETKLKPKSNQSITKEEANKNDNVNDNDNNNDNSIKEKVKLSNESDSVKNIYNLYPSKCPTKKSNTGKSLKDKEKIVKILSGKEHTEESLILCIKNYVSSCIASNTYLKHFGTFLNNLPDMTEGSNKNEAFDRIYLNTDENELRRMYKSCEYNLADNRFVEVSTKKINDINNEFKQRGITL